MRLTNVAALSLDLDDTLWAFAPAVSSAEAKLYQWLLQHAPATADVLLGPESLRLFRHNTAVARPDLSQDLTLLRRESIREVLRAAGEDPNLADEGYDVFYSARQHVTLFEDVLPALEWLSQRYPIAAVSNGNSDLGVIGIQHFFSATFVAADLGVAKPDPRIFRAAASALGVPPEQMLHVGDDIQLDVEGALSAGLQAAWLVRGEQSSTPDWPVRFAGSRLTLRNLRELCDFLNPDLRSKHADTGMRSRREFFDWPGR